MKKAVQVFAVVCTLFSSHQALYAQDMISPDDIAVPEEKKVVILSEPLQMVVADSMFYKSNDRQLILFYRAPGSYSIRKIVYKKDSFNSSLDASIYKFESSSEGIQPGDMFEFVFLKFHLNNGNN